MNNLLAITYAFMLAYCPYDNTSMGEIQEFYQDATHVEFELGLKVFDMISVFAGEETLQVMDGSITNWKPYTQKYWLGAEYGKEFNKKFCINAGIKHYCQHPIDNWNQSSSVYNASRTELYLKLSGQVDIF